MWKYLKFALVAFFSAQSFAVYQVGDTIPDMCWNDAFQKPFCLKDAANKVRVLNYGTGWCPDCNKEMQELVPKVNAYAKLPVVFLSLMAASFKSGGAPDPEFLKAWKEKFQIPFPVLASPKDAGRPFFEPPYAIPNFVIIDKAGKLAFKSMEAGVEEMLQEVDKLL